MSVHKLNYFEGNKHSVRAEKRKQAPCLEGRSWESRTVEETVLELGSKG